MATFSNSDSSTSNSINSSDEEHSNHHHEHDDEENTKYLLYMSVLMNSKKDGSLDKIWRHDTRAREVDTSLSDSFKTIGRLGIEHC
jgi:hypothetical protein